MIRKFHTFWMVLMGISTGLTQNVVFNSTPEWISQPLNHVATGLGIADINQDGWEDLIVANGNDIYRQNVVVYYADGNGGFPTAPSWSSSDIDYHGHLSIGDINADGYPDVAVSVFLGPAGFSEPGYAKIYLNQNGQLEGIPSFRTSDRMYTFSCALGDADGDGDLDLAVAGGEPYNNVTTYGRIYFNENGILDTLPAWQSQVLMSALDVDFADMDNNGFLDLIFACHLTPNYIFMADSTGQIPTAPAWQSQDNSYYANSLTTGLIDDNDFLDLIVSDNSQLGGQGKYKAYFFDQAPAGQTNPGWYSNTGGYGSAVLAADINGNGRADLIAGRWWNRVEIFSDTLGRFSFLPTWWSGTYSVIEAFALRDVNRDGLGTIQFSDTVSSDSIHVIDVKDTRLEKFLQVRVNQQVLNPGTEYCFVSGATWLSFRNPLQSGDLVEIEYIASRKKDLAVSNWDNSRGNYLFYNQSQISTLAELPEMSPGAFMWVYPNPFNQRCHFAFTLSRKLMVDLIIYDVLGRRVKQVVRDELPSGSYRFSWDGRRDDGTPTGSGMYYFKFQSGADLQTGKLLILQ